MRRFYEARVLVVPQGESARAVTGAMRRLGLDGVMTLVETGRGYARRPLAEHGWADPCESEQVADAVSGADIVVLLAADLAEVRAEVCHAAAQAARERGALLAALIVGSHNHDTPAGNTAMVVLRAEADMLVEVRGPGLAAPFLDVLRGGRREPVRDATAGERPGGPLDQPRARAVVR